MPRYRLLLTASANDDFSEIWNALLEFTLLVNYEQLSPEQRIFAVASDFHGWVCNGGVGHGFELLESDGISQDEFFKVLTVLGAKCQHKVITTHINSPESRLDREYDKCKPDLLELAMEYAKKNIDNFVKWN